MSRTEPGRASWLMETSWPYGVLVVAMLFGASLLGLGVGLHLLFAPDSKAPAPLQALLPLPPDTAGADTSSGYLQRTVIEADSVAALRRSFEAHDYDLALAPEQEAALPPVPPVALERLPRDLGALDDIDERKRLFVQSVLPLVLMANRTVRTARRLVVALSENGEPPSEAEQMWLDALAERYGVPPGDRDTLLKRLDEVPVAIALAQAAVETGWGTSRFAVEGNALYGMRTWRADLDGMVPEERRDGEDFKVRQFEAPFESVWSYLHNLNTSPHYADWRAQRAALRAEGQPLTAEALLEGLSAYSELGAEYVGLLEELIRGEGLERLQEARLDGSAVAKAGAISPAAR